MLGLIGMAVFMIRCLPDFLRFSEFDFLMNKLILHINVIHYLYQYRIFEYIFVLSFVTTVFGLLMFSSGVRKFRQQLKICEQELDEKKLKLKEIEAGKG